MVAIRTHVTEVAKGFYGMDHRQAQAEGGLLQVRAANHEPRPKFVAGTSPAEGEGEGNGSAAPAVHESADGANFISLEARAALSRDDPPPPWSIGWRKRFERKKGTSAKSLSHTVSFARVLGRRTYRAEVKTPLEFVRCCAASQASEWTRFAFDRGTFTTWAGLYLARRPPTAIHEGGQLW